MSLTTLLLICMGVFAFLRYVIVPRFKIKAELAVSSNDRRLLLRSAGPLAAAEKLKELTLGACIGFGLLAVIVVTLSVLHTNSLESVQRTIAIAGEAEAALKATSDRITIGMFFLAFVGMAVLWYRAGKRRTVQFVEDAINAQVSRLAAESEANPVAWQEWQPSNEMRSVWLSLQSVLHQLDDVRVSDPEAEKKRDALREEAERRARTFRILDIQRRISPGAIFENHEGPTNLWTRLSRLVLNKGVFADLKGITSLLSYAVNALFCILLVGFGSGVAATTLAARSVDLQDLQVKLSLKESENARQKAEGAKSDSVPSTSIDQQDQQAARALARAMSVKSGQSTVSEASHAHYSSGESARPGDFVGHAHEANAAAPEVIAADVETRTASRDMTEAGSVAEHASQAPDVTQKTAIDFADSAVSQNPSSAEKFFMSQIVRRRKSSAIFRDAVLTWWKSHREPLDFTELATWSAEETLGRFAGLATGEESGLKLAADVLSDAVKKSATAALDIDGNVFFAQYGSTGDIGASLEAIGDPSQPYRKLDSLILRVLDDNIPDGPSVHAAAETLKRLARRASVHSIPPDVVDIVQSLPEQVTKGQEVAFAEAVSDFDAEYPRDKLPTLRDKVLSALSAQDTNGIDVRKARSTDFGALKSYSRVGGILFGSEGIPTARPLDFTGLSWQRKDSQITLVLRRRDGMTFTIGPFAQVLVYQALNYVADKRLTVVTLLNANLIERQQVMLHPAFADTPLGCRIIRDDQWIFHYADPPAGLGPSTQLRQQLNTVQWDMKLYKEGFNILKHPETGALPDTLPQIPPSAVSPFTSPETKAFFDDALAEAVQYCRSKKSSKEFSACIRNQAEGKAWVARLGDNAPRTGFVSQIRESDYTLDPDLTFLTGQRSGSAIWPLEWTVQMTVDDKAAWKFSAFDEKAAGMVLEGLARDGRMDELKELRDLCILQRFLRVAISGKFGYSFPLTRLPDLAEASRPQSNRLDTPRWVKESGSDRAGTGKYFRSYHPPASGGAFPGAPTLFGSCADTLESGAGIASLRKACTWKDLARRAAVACRMGLDAGQSFEGIDACQVFSRTAQANTLVSIFELQDKLGATRAIAEDSIRCPAPVVARTGSE